MPIDNNVRFTDNEGKQTKSCDGVLTYDSIIIFVELKEIAYVKTKEKSCNQLPINTIKNSDLLQWKQPFQKEQITNIIQNFLRYQFNSSFEKTLAILFLGNKNTNNTLIKIHN